MARKRLKTRAAGQSIVDSQTLRFFRCTFVFVIARTRGLVHLTQEERIQQRVNRRLRNPLLDRVSWFHQ